MSINQRIIKIINLLEEGSRVNFGRKIGVSRSGVNSMIQKEGSVGKKNLERIVNTYPLINISWLLTGEGEMLKEEQSENSNKNTTVMVTEDPRSLEQFVKYLLRYNAELQNELSQLREDVARYSKKTSKTHKDEPSSNT